jgi:phage terminase large subunit-like protein
MANTDALIEQILRSLPPDAIPALMAECRAELDKFKLADYRPYPKQVLFHTLGAGKRERLLRAGNQNGKSFCVGAEAAYHLTGRYPDWWEGRVWERPTIVWASGETAEATRDNPQRVLLGLPKEEGTGAVPAEDLGEYGMASGTADLFDYIKVKHYTNGVFDGWSMLRFKYYAQGRRKWQGPPVDFVWFDEEPPEDIYDEGLARTIATGGMAAMSFTPLQGMSSVVLRFLGKDKTDDRADINMTIEDAEHIPAEEKARIIASFPLHEREARAKGIPTLGSGRIFPVPEEDIRVAPFEIPKHWARLVGGDFGWAHPSAWVWLAHDRDTDIVYVTHIYRCSETLIPMQALTISAQGKWIPVSWPHDGYQVKDAMHGEQLAQQYRDHGVNMRPEHAQFPETPVIGEVKASRISTEAGIQAMLTRMMTGKFKVFSHLEEWFEEFRLYHRKNGLIVKERDDLMSATRIGIMDLRFAITEPSDEASDSSRRRNWRVM